MLFANVALPSFIGHWIVFIILLPLIAVVETVVLHQVLKTPLKDSFFTAASANWRSTKAGLPAGWLMALAGLVPAGVLVIFLPSAYRYDGFQIIAFTAFTGGLIPNRFTPVAIPIANLLILIPYYIATVRVERQVVQSRHSNIESERVILAVKTMNRITYTILAGLVGFWLLTAVSDYQESLQEVPYSQSANIPSDGEE